MSETGSRGAPPPPRSASLRAAQPGHPGDSASPSRRVFDRLAVEQRILGLLALLGLIQLAFVACWIVLALDPASLRELIAGPIRWLAPGIAALALLANTIHVTLRLPSVRWPRSD